MLRKEQGLLKNDPGHFKVEIKPENINCDGWSSNRARLFNFRKVCEIRKCGME